jgi:hypothetical protein
MENRPGRLTAICAIAIVLGVWGFLLGAFSIGSLILRPRVSVPNRDPKLATLHAEFERRVNDLQKELRPRAWVQTPLMLMLSVLLAAAGISGLRLRGWTFLKVALIANLVGDGLNAILGWVAQARTMEIMEWYAKELAAQSPMPQVMESVMQASTTVGLVLGALWQVAKAVYYVWSLLSLRKPALRDAFAPKRPGVNNGTLPSAVGV